MGFRINSFSATEDALSVQQVKLHSTDNRTDNIFSIIIGNNGAGKSRFLSQLVNIFTNSSEQSRRAPHDYNVEYSVDGEIFEIEKSRGQQAIQNNVQIKYLSELFPKLPNRVIALTTSISDRFPQDNYSRRRFGAIPSDEGESQYRYLGPKTRTNGTSSRALMDRAIQLMLSNFNSNIAESYRSIFEYLNYEPVIKFTYHISRIRNSNLQLEGYSKNGAELKDHIERNLSHTSGFRSASQRKALEIFTENHWEKLANLHTTAYISSRQNKDREYSFTLNFSEQNLLRNSSTGEIEQEIYLLFEDLRQLDLARGPNISLYKIDGGEFDFYDASSGEASILSSLIGLIPCLASNSLVVIDEPEISLHPTWQYKYISLIDKLLEKHKGCHIIVATHSHFIVSDLPIGRSSIIHFEGNKRGNIRARYINEETNGWSAEDILLSVFDMPSTRNYYLSALLSEALEIIAEGSKQSSRLREITEKLKIYLPNIKDVDPAKDIIKTLITISENRPNENK